MPPLQQIRLWLCHLQVMLYKYDDEEWESLIKADSAGWSKEETDYLLDLCELYDLRFVVITDRYQVQGHSQHAHVLTMLLSSL